MVEGGAMVCNVDDDDVYSYIGERLKLGGTSMKEVGAQALLEVRHRFLVGSGRPSMLMLVRIAALIGWFVIKKTTMRHKRGV